MNDTNSTESNLYNKFYVYNFTMKKVPCQSKNIKHLPTKC